MLDYFPGGVNGGGVFGSAGYQHRQAASKAAVRSNHTIEGRVSVHRVETVLEGNHEKSLRFIQLRLSDTKVIRS